LQTDRLSYSFRESNGFFSTGPIRITLTNTSGSPAFVIGGFVGPELVLEGLEDGEWVTKYAKPRGGVGGGLRIEPGQSMVITTTVEGFLPGTCQCSPILDFGAGIYRFRILQGYVDSFDEVDGATGEELPLEFRVSNTFALDAP